MGAAERDPRRHAWRAAVAPYARSDCRGAFRDLITSILPYLGLMTVMLALVDISYLAVLILAVPAAGFMARTHLVMHDCAHGSLLPTRRANNIVGILVGLTVFQAFHCWRHDHVRHHASGGDLAADGTGDVAILTVDEFRLLPRWRRIDYRLRHHPLVVFGIGSFLVNIVKPRLPLPSDRPRLRWAKLATNAVMAFVLTGVCLLSGWREVLLAVLPTGWLAAGFGGWLIWVQHRFDGALWQRSPEWDWETAALAGSSHFKLPRVLQFFSLNIGLHHVHHLNPRIPNYNLSRANQENEFLKSVPTVSVRDGIKATRLGLYDFERGRLVSFAEAGVKEARAGTAEART